MVLEYSHERVLSMKKYSITGMSCAACSAKVEKAVSSLEGVESCAVNLLTNSMGVEGDVTDAEIIHAVEKAGYGASSAQKGTTKSKSSLEDAALEDNESNILKKRLISS